MGTRNIRISILSTLCTWMPGGSVPTIAAPGELLKCDAINRYCTPNDRAMAE